MNTITAYIANHTYTQHTHTLTHTQTHTCTHAISSISTQSILGTYTEQPYSGEVRLVGGEYPSEGRLEVFFNGQWGGVCSSGFDESDGDVICRQLGYTNSLNVTSSDTDR